LCPICSKNDAVIRYGKRKNIVRYFCKSCAKFFSVDFSTNKINNFNLLIEHLDGISLRKLSNEENNPSSTQIFARINPLIKNLPSCLNVTKTYCDMSKFSGKLVFDGTFVSVADYEDKIPMIWGFDYDSHDCPHSMLVPAENYSACIGYFYEIKLIGYKLRYLVCDDNHNIKRAAKAIFPNVIIQTCIRHYLENLRKILNTKTSDKYRYFLDQIKYAIYEKRLSAPELVLEIAKLNNKFGGDTLQTNILTDIMNRRIELTNYHLFENCPNTTNLIEGFNGHLKDRLKSIRGFKSFQSASLWLNAYVLRRRLTKFKACNRKFKYLNGKTPIESTLKIGEEIPNIFR